MILFLVVVQEANTAAMDPFETSAELLDAIESTGRTYRVMNHVPGGRPVVSVESGGDRDPPIVITAGSHANEQAGVRAAVELIEDLDTEHRVYVLPTRDPVGLNGYEYALSVAIGRSVDVATRAELRDLLAAEGEIVYRDDAVQLAQVGDLGFAVEAPANDGDQSVLGRIRDLPEESHDHLEPFQARRIYSLAGPDDDPFRWAFTTVVTPDGEPLHLNRFLATPWAPVESRCVRRLLAETDPGLFFDLHESGAEGNAHYWLSLRHKHDDSVAAFQKEVGRTMVDAVEARGTALTPLSELLGDTDPSESFFSEVATGVFELDYEDRGEGFNAVDYAAHEYGLAYTSETGKPGDFGARVGDAKTAVQRAVDMFGDYRS